MQYLKDADIVETNPPFSLFREYVALIVEYDKRFLVLSGINATTCKGVFPLIQQNKMWSGNRKWGGMNFEQENGEAIVKSAVAVSWLTNLEHGEPYRPLFLLGYDENLLANKTQKNLYAKYDNYDAIEVPLVKLIPNDYDEAMGVPFSFLDKYNPNQFEILGMCENLDLYGLKTKKYTSWLISTIRPS